MHLQVDLVHAMESNRGKRSLATIVPNFGARWRWVVIFTDRPLFLQKKNHVGWFHNFQRPRRPLGRVKVQLYSIFDLSTRSGWGVSVTPRLHLTLGEDPVPIVQDVGWASGPVWTGAENLALTGNRSPDRQARRQSLYRLRYPAHKKEPSYPLNTRPGRWKVAKKMWASIHCVQRTPISCKNVTYICLCR
jgi:hypothetical protein